MGDYGQQEYDNEVINSGYDNGNYQMLSQITSQHPTVVHEQLENEKLIRDIEMRLRGIRVNPLTKVIEPTGHPFIPNDEGVEKLLGIIQAHLDKAASLSDLNDEEIYKHMLDLYTEVTLFVYFDGYHYYGIKKGDLSIVTRIVCTPIFTTLKKARDALQLKQLGQMQKVMQTLGGGDQKQGFLSKLGIKL